MCRWVFLHHTIYKKTIIKWKVEGSCQRAHSQATIMTSKITEGNGNKSGQRSQFQLHHTWEVSVPSLFIRPSFNKFFTKGLLCTKSWGNKTVSERHRSFEPPSDPRRRIPPSAQNTKSSYLPFPTCGAMASASGQGVFLKNLSVNLVQLKTKHKNSTSPKQEGPEKKKPSHFTDKDPGSQRGRRHSNEARAKALQVYNFPIPNSAPQLFSIR